MKKINIAIIGLGQIGYTYDKYVNTKRTHFSQINNHKDLRLIAACDNEIKKLNQFKKDNPNILAYNNYISMIKNNSIDLLVLAIPSSSQKKIIDYSLSKNIKNFIVEKPFLNNNDELKEIIKRVSRIDGKIYVNYPRTWDNLFLSNFKKTISDEILYVNSFISGNFKENSCHLIDLIFQALYKSNDYPKFSTNHSNNNNISIKFKNQKHIFDINLTHINNQINLFEIQIFFSSHILVLEFGGAAVYTISAYKDKFYKNYNGMKHKKLNFYFDHQKGLKSLYSNIVKKFGEIENWEEKLLSSYDVHNLL